ncbi:hypothetical protein GCM10025871_30700 [Deinococcus metallilatus]|nr:hypothetical protein GCM10025871_30700 [Deinococcus metallilatus]
MEDAGEFGDVEAQEITETLGVEPTTLGVASRSESMAKQSGHEKVPPCSPIMSRFCPEWMSRSAESVRNLCSDEVTAATLEG